MQIFFRGIALQEKHFYSTNDIIEKIDIEPVELIKSFYPLTLLRRIYLTFTFVELILF